MSEYPLRKPNEIWNSDNQLVGKTFPVTNSPGPLDLTYNDTSSFAQDHICFTQNSDGKWNVSKENIKKVEKLMDKVTWLEKRNAELISRIKDLERETNYWWRQSELGNI